jgi:hypothetical protein
MMRERERLIRTQFERAPAMTLTDVQRLGLDFRWYLRWYENSEVNKILHCAYLVHFLGRIIKAFEDNNGSDRPCNWAELARFLGRNDKHTRRQKSAYQKAGDPDGSLDRGGNTRAHIKQAVPGTLARYGFSIALGVPESELSLSTAELLAAATEHLVRRHGGGVTISKREARAYGFYLFVGPGGPHSTQLDEKALRRVLKDAEDWPNADDLRRAILKVAQLVGEILLADFNAMLKQTGWI